jgi:hydrogenase expression/formation protein HypC
VGRRPHDGGTARFPNPNLTSRHMCLGIPGRVIERRDDGGFPMGVVDFGGVRREVCLAYVDRDVAVDDYVIVHVGFAISKVDEVEAKRTFEVLREMSQLDELNWMSDLTEPSIAHRPSPAAP